MIKLIALDLDDTLYLERDYVLSGLRAAAQSLERPCEAESFLETATKLFIEGERGKIFNLALKEIGHDDDPEVISEMLFRYRNHMPAIQLLPDASDFLDASKGRFATALVSDGYLPTQSQKVNALGLQSRIDEIILTEILGREFWKPHPRAFEMLESLFGTHQFECIYVGDNPTKDFCGPKSLGWKTVRIARPDSLHFSMPDRNDCIADLQIATLQELIPILDL